MNTQTALEYEECIGDLSVRALRQGGEVLLGKVMRQLGVAMRHLERIRNKELIMVPAVADEIEASFARANELLTRDLR